MATWTFEPGHSAAEFCVRHMMVTWVRGHFKNVNGTLECDPKKPLDASVELEIDAAGIWTGEPARDNHLRSADFLDVENHPKITFKGKSAVLIGEMDFQLVGNLTLRGVTKQVTLDMTCLGHWDTPYWVGNEDKGPITRVGYTGQARINRQDFGVSWNDTMDKGGIVVGKDVFITLDIEALKKN